MSTDVVEKKPINKTPQQIFGARPKAPEGPPPILSVEAVQAYVDWFQRSLDMPKSEAGVLHMSDEINPVTDRPVGPRKLCKFDAQGRIIPGSGVVVPDPAIEDLNRQLGCVLEQLTVATAKRISNGLDATGGDLIEPGANTLLINGEVVYEPFRSDGF